MKTKPKMEATTKWKLCLLASLTEMLTVQIQIQGCYRAAWVLPATVRYISDIRSVQEKHQPVSIRAGFFLHLEHLKTLVLSLILVPAKWHTAFADPLYISWGAASPEAAFLCPFVWMHLDYLPRWKILWSLLASRGPVINTSQSAKINQIKGSLHPSTRSSS